MNELYHEVVIATKLAIFMGHGSSCFKHRTYQLPLAVDFIQEKM